MTNGAERLAIFILNVAVVVCITGTSWTSGSASLSPVILGIIGIADIIYSFNHDKSSSISQLINGKSRYLQKLLKYVNGTTTSVSNILLSSDVLPISFVFYSKDLFVIVLLLFNLLLAGLFSFASSFISLLW